MGVGVVIDARLLFLAGGGRGSGFLSGGLVGGRGGRLRDDFAFKNTPINEALVRDLAAGGFIAQQRNVVLVEGTEPDS